MLEAYRSLYGDLTKLKDKSLLDDPASGTGYHNNDNDESEDVTWLATP